MTKIGKQDQIFIQRKLDGVLSSTEEEQFNELIESSTEARKYYQEMVLFHHMLKFNSNQISEVDFTDDIMETVEAKKIIERPLSKKVHLLASFNQRQLLAYAAILLTGLIIGSIATYFGTLNKRIPDADKISGTIVRPAGNVYEYEEGGTGINIQKVDIGDLRMLVVELMTKDTVFCTIQGMQETLSSPNIRSLFSEGKFQASKQGRGELCYLCSGKNVFLINNVNPVNRESILFTRQGKKIFEYKTK